MARLTSEDIILIILICFGSDLYQTLQAIVVDKCMDKIFVILHNGANMSKIH